MGEEGVLAVKRRRLWGTLDFLKSPPWGTGLPRSVDLEVQKTLPLTFRKMRSFAVAAWSASIFPAGRPGLTSRGRPLVLKNNIPSPNFG